MSNHYFSKGKTKKTRLQAREYLDQNNAKRPALFASSKPIRTNSVHIYESNLSYLDRYSHPSRPYFLLPPPLTTIVLSFLVGVDAYLDGEAVRSLANEAKEYSNITTLLDFLAKSGRIREAFHVSRTTFTLPTIICDVTGFSLHEQRLAEEINPTDCTLLTPTMGIAIFESDYNEIQHQADESFLFFCDPSSTIPNPKRAVSRWLYDRLKSAIIQEAPHAFHVLLMSALPSHQIDMCDNLVDQAVDSRID